MNFIPEISLRDQAASRKNYDKMIVENHLSSKDEIIKAIQKAYMQSQITEKDLREIADICNLSLNKSE